MRGGEEAGRRERRAGEWRLLTRGRARVETGPGRALLCAGPSSALEYSVAAATDGAPERLPHRGGVLEARVRLSGLHPGGAGWGFWNHMAGLGSCSAVWFLYLNAPGRGYPLRGLYAQSGRLLAPVAPLPGAGARGALRRLLLRLPLGPVRLVEPSRRLGALDPSAPHLYRVEWGGGRAVFSVDGVVVAELPAPRGAGAATLWVGNVVFEARRGDPGAAWRPVTLDLPVEACVEVLGV